MELSAFGMFENSFSATYMQVYASDDVVQESRECGWGMDEGVASAPMVWLSVFVVNAVATFFAIQTHKHACIWTDGY